MDFKLLLWLAMTLAVTSATISVDENVEVDSCLCVVGKNINARNGGGLNNAVVSTVSDPSCYKFKGGVRTSDGHTWYELKDVGGQNAWVSGQYLSVLNDTLCAGFCNGILEQVYACELRRRADNNEITLWGMHPSGVSDNAYAYNNIRDACEGRAASRSHYTCKECPNPGAPGGHTCLTTILLQYLFSLLSYVDYGYLRSLHVNEIAGACHSCSSKHYQGSAVDLHFNNALDIYDWLTDVEWMTLLCEFYGGKALNEGNHLHCRFN